MLCVFCLFLQAVYHKDPEYVVRRFESGRYAVNQQVREIYLEAVDMVEVSECVSLCHCSQKYGARSCMHT